jgi:hypothetical protein
VQQTPDEADPGHVYYEYPEYSASKQPVSVNKVVSLAHSGQLTPQTNRLDEPYVAQARSTFTREDYNAPTTAFNPDVQPQGYSPLSRKPLMQPRPPKQAQSQRKNRITLLIGGLSMLIVLIIGSMLYYGVQTVNAVSVAINFSPRQQTISQVYTFTASPSYKSVNATQQQIPMYIASLQDSSQSSGQTTGTANCSLGVFDCQQAVSQNDVTTLAVQMRSSLEQKILTEVQQKVSVAQGIQVTSIKYADPTATPTPVVGTVSNTVSVTLSETASIGYILTRDTTNLTNQLLAQTINQHYSGYQTLTGSSHTGAPAITSIDDAHALIHLQAAAGAVVRYVFTPEILQNIQDGLVGKSLSAATAFLQGQSGIDPNSVAIHFTSGSSTTLPNDPTSIKLIPLAPGSQPDVQLTPINGITPGGITPSPTATGDN